MENINKSLEFKKVATALAFSPRCKELLAEAKYYKDIFEAELILIHVGDKTQTKEDTIIKFCNELGMGSEEYKIQWKQGDAVQEILETCTKEHIDLLILGALKKENVVNYYLGSIARKISRNAKCSVLMLTEPKLKHKAINKIVVNHTEKNESTVTVDLAIKLAQHQFRTDIFLVNEVHQPALAYTMADGSSSLESKNLKNELIEDEVAELKDLCDKHSCETIRMISKTINGKPGYAVSNFAKIKKADLLVLDSPEQKLGFLDRIFTHDLEFVLADMPCNLMLVAKNNLNL